MKPASETLLDDIIDIQVDVAKYGKKVATDVHSLLSESEDDLLSQITKRIKSGKESSWTTKRLTDLLNQVKKINADAYSAAAVLTKDSLLPLATETSIKIKKSFDGLKTRIDFWLPSAEQLASAVNDKPIKVGDSGKLLLEEIFEDLAAGKEKTIRQAVRLGVVEGESIDDIVKRLKGTKAAGYKDGLLEAPRRHTEAMVRTSVNHVSNTAAQMTFEQNSDVIKGVQWHSTLDTRTSPTCRVLDGKVFPIDSGPRPPAHVRCRSFMVPITKSWKELGIDLEEIPEGTRASMDGQVPSTVTYEQWLRRQPIERVSKVLGAAKAERFISGEKLEELASPSVFTKLLSDVSIIKPTALFQKLSDPAIGPMLDPVKIRAIDVDRRLGLYRSDLKRALIDETPLPPRLSKLLDDLSEVDKSKLLSEVDKSKLKLKGRPSAPADVLDEKMFARVSEKKGSNPGGLFRHKVTGEEWYLKFPDSDLNAKNELLANRLYRMAGIDVPETTILRRLDGSIGVASKWESDLALERLPSNLAKAKGVKEGFVVDAWLANWDVVGSNYDNLLLRASGSAVRIDSGGALLYRAKNGLKGSAFGSEVGELKSFLSAAKNPSSFKVFGDVTRLEMKESAKRVLAITDDDIRKTLAEHGPYASLKENKDLAELLIKRKSFIAKEFPESVPGWVAPRNVLLKNSDLKFEYSEALQSSSAGRKESVVKKLLTIPEAEKLEIGDTKSSGGVYKTTFLDDKGKPALIVTSKLYKDGSLIYDVATISSTKIPSLRPKLIENWGKYYSELEASQVAQLKKIMSKASPWMRIHPDTSSFSAIDAFLSPGGYKGQVQIYKETGRSFGSGMVDPERRQEFEIAGFGVSPDGSDWSRFPKYGYWEDTPTGLPRGREYGGPSQYGKIRVKFKPEVKSRATATIGDSLDTSITRTRLGSGGAQENPPFNPNDPHPYAITKQQLPSTASNIQDLSHRYVEAQYYGTLTADDIEALYMDRSTFAKVTATQKHRLAELGIEIHLDD